mgnify:CR=1 FL=1
MLGEGKVTARVLTLLEALPPDARRRIARHVFEAFGGPLTPVEKMQRHRAAALPNPLPNPLPNGNDIGNEIGNARTKVSNNPKGLDYTPGFCGFWSVYPRRIGKGAAFLSWKRSGCEVVSEVMVQAVREQLPYLVREGGKFTPLPATWLNQRRWEDSPTLPKSQAQQLWDEAQEEKRRRGIAS